MIQRGNLKSLSRGRRRGWCRGMDGEARAPMAAEDLRQRGTVLLTGLALREGGEQLTERL